MSAVDGSAADEPMAPGAGNGPTVSSTSSELPQEVVGLSVTTLKEAIDEGLVSKPPLCSWVGWQHWRRDYGSRPAVPGSVNPY